MLPLLDDYFQRLSDELRGTSRSRRRFSYLGVVGPLWEHFATFFVFADGEKAPLFRVKIARDARGSEQLLAEREVVHALTAAGAAGGVPRLLMCEELAGRRVWIESAPEGSPLVLRRESERPPRRRFAAALETVTAWLADLHVGTAGLRAVEKRDGRGLAAERLVRFRESFALSHEAVSWASELLESSGAADWSGDAPFAHGELRAGKVFDSGGEVTVVDWHRAGPRLPLYDLLTFLLADDEPEGRRGPAHLLEWMSVTLLRRTAYSQVVWRCLSELCRARGLSQTEVWPLLGLFVVDSALRQQEVSREAADIGLRRREGEEKWVLAFERLARALRPPYEGLDLSLESAGRAIGGGNGAASGPDISLVGGARR